ncbi:putative DNA polymerase iota [Aspergillus stella-maris]|uniref:putative DNA polymerase iota n=1 Tax=Aspergillus stella-maris TaxID=1810926 RepID=UPI003CCD5753
MAPPPQRDDKRIIIHFDYDCFYASVFENAQPILRTLPLAVQQKQIVVTCNYEARRRGLRKLQLIKEAKEICPDVVIVLGEDLSRFRDVSKELYSFLRGVVSGWDKDGEEGVVRVERLGFDEVFVDVTGIVDFNVELLNANSDGLGRKGFFRLSREDPTRGFEFDPAVVCGYGYPEGALGGSESHVSNLGSESGLELRLRLASHLAGYLRAQLEEKKGYTATAGISTSKLLAKVVGSAHKPNNQTTLLPPYGTPNASDDSTSNVLAFLDPREVRAIPGLGSKLSRRITSFIASRDPSLAEDKVTIRDVRLFPEMGPSLLEKILGGSGAPRDIGVKVWGLLHGVDSTPVAEARDTPTQISIENSYGHLDNFDSVRKEMGILAISLIRRMRTDLTESYSDAKGPDSSAASEKPRLRWLARPRTLRVSTVPRALPGTDATQLRGHGRNRISTSAPLPQYIFNLEEFVDALAKKLVRESTTSMFRKLHPQRSGWNLRVLNLAVTNMTEVAGTGSGKNNSGRDISTMFQKQEAAVPEPVPSPSGKYNPPSTILSPEEASWDSESDGEENMPCVPCSICGASIPQFALVAHKVYHSSEE